MEYSLNILNKKIDLNFNTLTNLINKLNLIGLEVDDTIITQSVTNDFLTDIKLLIKIPSDREELLLEKLFLLEIKNLFLGYSKIDSKKIKKNYSYFFKQKYNDYYKYEIIPINSVLSNITIYSVEINNINNKILPLWIEKKLLSYGKNSERNINDLITLTTLEWGHTFNIINKNENFNDNLILEKLIEPEFFIDQNNVKHLLQKDTIVLKTKNNEIISVLGLFNFNITKNTSKIILQNIFYDPYENKNLLNILGTNNINNNFSLKYLRKAFLEYFRLSFQRLLTLFEIIYPISISPKIYTLNKGNILNVSLDSKKILKLKKIKLKQVLNLETYDLEIFKKAGLLLICNTINEFYFIIPNSRKDLLREIDIIEEYSKFIGYKNLTEILPKKELVYSKLKKENIYFIKEYFLNYGFNEIITNPFEQLNIEANNKVEIQNPLNLDFKTLRQIIIPKIIEVFETNLRKNLIIKNYFEIGRTFKKFNNKIIEKDILSGIFQIESIKKSNKPSIEWFIAKGFIENFISNFGYKNCIVEKNTLKTEIFHSTKSIQIKYKNKILGIFGELSPNIKNISSKYATYIFELNLEYFLTSNLYISNPIYKSFSKYPPILKDLSFTVDKNINFNDLKEKLNKEITGINSLEYFDIYFDDNNIKNVNLAIRVDFNPLEFLDNKKEKIISTEDIERKILEIKEFLISNFNVTFK